MLRVERRGEIDADLVRRRGESGLRIRLVRIAEWKPMIDVPVLSFHTDPTRFVEGTKTDATLYSTMPIGGGFGIQKGVS